MCGICGKVGREAVSAEEIREMAGVLAHRGPDDAGVYADGGVGLGHRRLSIIDLSGGHQPLSNEDETVWITFNGEIYNFKLLREELIRQGHRFRTDSDTETIVHLYEEKGESCVEDLRGMFAFAIWDARRRRLFLARDHLGQKPLYYAVDGESIVFASEIKAILADRPELARVNGVALKEYLTLRVVSSPRSMFEGIHKLPPGHTLSFQDGEVRTRSYWDLDFRDKVDRDERELLEELDARVRDAIELHLVSDVEVGAFLSGGLDSSLIVAMLSRQREAPVKTFSVGLPYKGYNELPYASTVSERCRTVPFMAEMPASVLSILPRVLWHLDEPADPLAICMFHLAEMARREVKVVLGGDGGDELFGGYDRYYGNRYVGVYAALPAVVREQVLARLIRHVPDGFWYKSWSQKLRWIHELSFLRGSSRYARSLSYFYFPPRWDRELFGPRLREVAPEFDPEAVIRDCYDHARADDFIDRMLYADCKVRLPNHPVMILDRSTMAYGLEARSPFLDHRLMEFAASLPSRWKVRGGRLRYLQTLLARRYLPDEIVSRRKQGFSSALPYLLSADFRLLFSRFLERSQLVDDGYLRPEPIQRLLGEHLAGRADHGSRLWLLANSELWYRMSINGLKTDELAAELESTAGEAALAARPSSLPATS